VSQCVVPFSTFTCSNSGGTSCTKVAVTVYVPSSAVPCPSNGFRLLNDLEFGHSQANPFVLSASDALLISGAVIAVWAAAWAWKALGRVLASDGEALGPDRF
jgi:hypothetical protein